MVIGGLTGCILDNLLPGTPEERGIIKWLSEADATEASDHIASTHHYDLPFLTEKFMRSKVCRYLPFMPYYGDKTITSNCKDAIALLET